MDKKIKYLTKKIETFKGTLDELNRHSIASSDYDYSIQVVKHEIEMTESILDALKKPLADLIHKKIINIDEQCELLPIEYIEGGVEDIKYKYQRLQQEKALYNNLLDEYLQSQINIKKKWRKI